MVITIADLAAKVDELRNGRAAVAALAFSDVDRETFKNEVVSIVDKLLLVDFRADFAPYTQEEYVSFVWMAAMWLEKLQKAVGNRICDEMAFCLKSVIAKWDPLQAQRLVVFVHGDYAIRKEKRNKKNNDIDILLTMAARTGVPLSKEPVFIHVPDNYKDHILANVVLFHEVGHYVDYANAITEFVFEEILPLLKKNKVSRFKREWFPRANGVDFNTDASKNSLVKRYIEEYIADIFGAQYAHEHILCYLSFIRARHSGEDTETHPSLHCRKCMVEAFCDYCKTNRTTNPLLSAIIKYFPTALSLSACTYAEADLTDAALSFADIDKMLEIFPLAWDVVIRESKRVRIVKYSVANYEQVLALPHYVAIDSNIKRAIRDLSQS